MNVKVTKLGLELKVVLEQEASLLENLLEIMQDEREFLVRFQPKALEEQTKRKELLVLQHSYLDQGRQDLTARLAKELGFEESDPPLSALCEVIDGELGKKLEKVHVTLKALIESIQELNEINQRLIEFSIRSVKGSVAFLKRRFFASETYSAGGVINQEIAQLSSLNSRA